MINIKLKKIKRELSVTIILENLIELASLAHPVRAVKSWPHLSFFIVFTVFKL